MNLIKYFLLVIPLLLSYIFSTETIFSYFLAWGGSIWVFYFSLSGNLKPLPNDRSLLEQAMRPMVLPHIIFAGYMCLTSVFYFYSQLGYTFFDKDPFYLVDWKQMELMAQCQRYYLAGHCAYVIGIASFMNYEEPKYEFIIKNVPQFMLTLSIILSLLSTLIQFLPGLTQVSVIFSGISIVASIMSLAFALPENAFGPKIIAGGLFAINYITALTSGWKEAIIVPLILLASFLYKNYKKMVAISGPIIIIIYFTYIPSYNSIVRSMAWNGEMEGKALIEYAIKELQDGNVDIAQNNWDFLTTRLSEISMFSKYVESVPSQLNYYNLKIVQQSIESVLPRIFFPNKPVTEKMVMERVVAAGVVSEYSIVSAKPAYIVDCYLSYGFIGIIIGCFALGSLISFLSVKAESIFGGYVFGSGLMFTGIFMQLWRANCFEFVANLAVWGYIFMLVLFNFFKSTNLLKGKFQV